MMTVILPEGADVFEHVWHLYTNQLKDKVRSHALDLANQDGRDVISPIDAFEAIRAFLPGNIVVSGHSILEKKQGWFNANVTGFIGITGFLALAFGFLGLVPFFTSITNPEYIKAATAFMDISKIFAGALVGGAAGAVATTASRKT